MSAAADSAGPDVIVVGAGIVGMAAALALQQAGRRVAVIDRLGPGEACSKGNAGHFAIDHVMPLAMPGILREVPRMLADPLGPLTVRWRHLPTLLPWLLRFVASARRVEPAARALAALCRQALPAYAPLLADAAAEDLVVRNGSLIAYDSAAGHQAGVAGLEAVRRYGVRGEALSAGQLAELEPALRPGLAGGLLFHDTAHTIDPFKLVVRFATRFAAAGGTILRDDIRAIETGPTIALQGDRRHQAATVVVAAGVWSGRLAAQVGCPVPLEAERGYHLMLPQPAVQVNRPLTWGERRFVLTPMADGLRLAGTVELASIDAPPNYRRAFVLADHARQLVPGLDAAGGAPWMGCRPSLPDSLPVIGPTPGRPNLVWAFGHQHLGLTLAAVTARLVAGVVAGTPVPGIDLADYRIDRFGRRRAA